MSHWGWGVGGGGGQQHSYIVSIKRYSREKQGSFWVWAGPMEEGVTYISCGYLSYALWDLWNGSVPVVSEISNLWYKPFHTKLFFKNTAVYLLFISHLYIQRLGRLKYIIKEKKTMPVDICKARVNSLWPSDCIRWHRSWSTLAQVMACSLTTPSHYRNQYWLAILVRSWNNHMRAIYTSASSY